MSRDLYAEITDRFIAELERGCAPWVRPWQDGKTADPSGILPYNHASGKQYRGMNILLLWGAEYPTPAWLTYRQAQSLGGNVRRGEHGSLVVFYKQLTVDDRQRPGELTQIPLLRHYTVFNVAQCDGLQAAPVDAPTAEPVTDATRYDAADKVLAQATVIHGGNMAYYAPGPDKIVLPPRGQFESVEHYYGTALHELTHWTGHRSRLAREYGHRFGDSAYAREELCAELGAAFLCAATGVRGQLRHVEYLDNWLKVLKEDKRAVVTAAAHAQKAADYVLTVDESADSEQELAA